MRRADVLDMVRARRAALGESADGGSGADGSPGRSLRTEPDALGVDAAAAWAARPWGSPLDPLPETVAHALSSLPPEPVSPPAWDVDVPRELGIKPARVDVLAHDAAARAHAVLATGAPTHLRISEDADLARRAAELDRRQADALARLLGWHPARLAARVEAWRLGGSLGVAMLAEPDLWSRDQAALDAGRDALMGLGYSRRQVSLNYDGLRMRGSVWLALGPDDRWYRFREVGTRHEMHLEAPPADDITDLVEPPPPSS
jgi:hypothetical protein